ncbi:endogenous retrovirus group k member 11 pol protein [Plakobranchus ocellatus]|uniref:Endogenous retrovirus group k member 11 pol protein n=1 Tax=Plakobranchus ocellatus TaxID=259542 RepID=A0AAV4D2U0_9GAST|nr:endogenous retrovirus group k member 11 pol protein [Plakobranchus ocellatus]
MVQYLSRYISNLTEDLHPIQNITKKMFHSFGRKARKTLFWPLKPKSLTAPTSPSSTLEGTGSRKRRLRICQTSPALCFLTSIIETVQDRITLRGNRIVIPSSLRLKVNVHAGPHGINSCLRRARDLIFWPGIFNDIRAFLESCDTCATFCARQPEQPLLTHGVPPRPWQKVGSDIFSISGTNYLVTVDYFSTFIEVDYLQDIASATVIHKLKHQFARHGIPEIFISDKFAQFASEWKFRHTRSAPGNKKADGAAEAAVKVIKNMMIKCRKSNEDPYIELLNLRKKPAENLAISPVQRLMSRRKQTIIPATDHDLMRPSKILASDKFNMDTKKLKMSQMNINRPILGLLNKGNIVRMQPIDNTKEWKEPK